MLGSEHAVDAIVLHRSNFASARQFSFGDWPMSFTAARCERHRGRYVGHGRGDLLESDSASTVSYNKAVPRLLKVVKY